MSLIIITLIVLVVVNEGINAGVVVRVSFFFSFTFKEQFISLVHRHIESVVETVHFCY